MDYPATVKQFEAMADPMQDIPDDSFLDRIMEEDIRAAGVFDIPVSTIQTPMVNVLTSLVRFETPLKRQELGKRMPNGRSGLGQALIRLYFHGANTYRLDVDSDIG